MRYIVRLTTHADGESDAIYFWIHKRSPEGAARWFQALIDLLDRLVLEPQNFGLAPEADAFEGDLREALFKTTRGNAYRALFVVRKATVLAIRGPGQPPVAPSEIMLPS